MIRPGNPRFEHHEQNTIGIGDNSPRISWSFETDTTDSDWIQAAYELEVIWSDGTTVQHEQRSASNSLVAWPWRRLQSRERASVRVRVKGSDDSAFSAWSDLSSVEAGLLSDENWKCSLIEPLRILPAEADHPPVTFHKRCVLKGKVVAARLYITAHGVYEASLNGHVVGDHVLAPGWTSYNHRLTYQTIDVTTQCQQEDRNLAISVTVAEGWFCGRLGFLGGRNNIYGSSVGLMAQLHLTLEDGSVIIVGTDDTWEWTSSSITSSGLYAGEVCDMTIEESAQPLAAVRTKPLPDGLSAPVGPPVRRVSEVLVKEVLFTPSGKKVLDFGQNLVGRVRVQISGPKGTTVIFRHAEVLEKGEIVTRTLRGAAATDTVILSGVNVEYEAKFTFHGFRYVQVDGWPDSEIDPTRFKAIVLHTDMQRTGFFQCSNAMLNQLHSNIVWSMRSNFLSIPTDCPQRDERLGWTGDIAVFSDTANFLYDTHGILRSWLLDLSAEQGVNNGIVPLTIPNIVEGLEKEAHALWGDAAIMVPWSLFTSSGDTEILLSQYDSMRSWLQAIPRHATGLWNYTSQWKLADWLDPLASPEDPGNTSTDPDFVSNVLLAYVTGLMVNICRILSKTDEELSYAEDERRIRQAICHEYISPSGRLSPDTQTAYVLALYTGCLEDSQCDKAAERLEELIRRRSRFSIATGFAGTPYIGHALSKLGLTNLFYRMLLHQQCPSWLYPVTMDATTLWERWDSMLPDGSINPGEMTSFNHYALGAVGDWMHKVILGLRPLRPGWTEFAVQPVPGGGLQWARGEYLTPCGKASVVWRIVRDDRSPKGMFDLTVTVPPNTIAHVQLPSSKEVEKRGSGVWNWSEPYIIEAWPPKALYPPFASEDANNFTDEAPLPFGDAAGVGNN